MISTKMKEDAAKISSEIKKMARKLPLAFLNYTYLNEDAQVVLKRRSDQLNEIQVTEFLSGNCTFSEAVTTCKNDFMDVEDQLKRYGVETKVLDDAPRNDSKNTSAKNYLTVPCANNYSGMIHQSDTSVTKYRKHLNL